MACRLDGGRPRGEGGLYQRGAKEKYQGTRVVAARSCAGISLVHESSALMRLITARRVVVPLSRAEETRGTRRILKKREREKERGKEKYGDKQSSVLFDRGDALI